MFVRARVWVHMRGKHSSKLQRKGRKRSWNGHAPKSLFVQLNPITFAVCLLVCNSVPVAPCKMDTHRQRVAMEQRLM